MLKKLLLVTACVLASIGQTIQLTSDSESSFNNWLNRIVSSHANVNVTPQSAAYGMQQIKRAGEAQLKTPIIVTDKAAMDQLMKEFAEANENMDTSNIDASKIFLYLKRMSRDFVCRYIAATNLKDNLGGVVRRVLGLNGHC